MSDLLDQEESWHEVVRNTDPETSRNAAKKATRDRKETEKGRQNVRYILRTHGPCTDEEIYLLSLPRMESGEVPSRTDDRLRHYRLQLVNKGDVKFAGYTRETSTRTQAQVWELVSP